MHSSLYMEKIILTIYTIYWDIPSCSQVTTNKSDKWTRM